MPDIEEKLIDEIQRLEDELGRPPTTDDIQSASHYPVHRFRTHFGSWSGALEAAGFEVSRPGRRYSTDELLDEIQRLAEELDEPPTKEQLKEKGKYSESPYRNHFGSWSKALQAAGFEDRSKPHRSTEEYIAELNRLADRLGKTPTANEMREEGKYSVTPYTERFGTWTEALEAAGLNES